MTRNLLIINLLFLILAITTSCVEDKVYTGASTIESVSISPTTPQSTEPVTIKAKITDLKLVTSVKLFYKSQGTATYTSIDMISLSSEQYMYAANIPAYPKDVMVQFYIEVVNSDNITSTYPKNASSSPSNYTVGASQAIKVVVNEVFANGDKTVENPDWMEIYNDSEIPVDISGYAIYDSGIKKDANPKRIIAEGVIIPAKGFLVLKTDVDSNETILFGLSTDADAVYLENKDGIVVSQISWDATILGGTDLKSGKSYGSKPDGSTNYVIFTTPTKGTSNNNAN